MSPYESARERAKKVVNAAVVMTLRQFPELTFSPINNAADLCICSRNVD
jgi:hypothetical protein